VILAGDIGGTKTRLGLFERRGGSAVAAATCRTGRLRSASHMLVSIYGARASDVALSYGATGGVYLGGGIAPRLVSRMLEGAVAA
jgi:glucokinase